MSTLDEAKAIFARAEQAVDYGQFTKALDLFADLAFHPGTTAEMLPALHWNMGICHAETGDLEAAFAQVRAAQMSEDEFRVTLAERGVPTDPDQLALRRLYTKASDLVRSESFQAALDEFTELMIHPALTTELAGPIHWDMALCFAHLGDWEKAEAHINTAGYDIGEFHKAMTGIGISADAGVSDARAQYYGAAEMVRAERYEEALDVFADLAFNGSIGADSLPALFFDMAVCCAHLGRWDTAREHVAAGHHSLAEFEVTMELRGAPAPPVEEE
jgi:tetratricopeptide (TPR) repeat protein